MSEKYEIIIKIELHEGLQIKEVAEELKEQLETFCQVIGPKGIEISMNDPIPEDEVLGNCFDRLREEPPGRPPGIPLALRFIPEDVRREIEDCITVNL